MSVGPRSVSHLVESQAEAFLPKITISVLSVLSLRKLVFIQATAMVRKVANLVFVVGESIVWVSSL